MIHVVVDDLAFVVADAVVRPATTLLEPTTPSLRRLEQVGGAAFWEGLRIERELAVGSAVVTAAGDLAAELVIHAIIRGPTEPVSRDSVRRALTAVLQRATDWQLAHLAMPLLGIGAGNLSQEDAAQAMAGPLALLPALGGFPSQVTVVVETDEERRVCEAALGTGPA